MISKLGVVPSCKITGHPAFFGKLPTFWAVKTNIQISGELTTSRGPGTSFQFALSLAKQLFGETTAKSVEEFLVSILLFTLYTISVWQQSSHSLLFQLLRDDHQNPKREEFNSMDWSLNHTPRVSRMKL